MGEYERWVDGGVKSDVWLFYFDRGDFDGWGKEEEDACGKQ